jgi:5-formyltetrahydrofolate cyclo-ligase
MPSEPDVSGFNDWVLGAGRRLLLPEITGESLSWREPGAMVPGRFGVLSPTGTLAELTDADLIVIPALAIDHSGFRLGQGGGYYDRALATPGAREGFPKLVAVVFDHEIIDLLPREAHDVAVDSAVSPARILHFSNR